MADIRNSFLSSLAAAEAEAAAGKLWGVAIKQGVMQTKAIPQHVCTLKAIPKPR